MPNVSAATVNADQLRRRANRRLLGASVLLLIAIILVPIFLEREPPPLPDNVDVKIPPIDGTKFDPKLPERKGAQTELPTITEPTGAAAGAPAAPTAVTSSVQPPPSTPAVNGANVASKAESTRPPTSASPPSNGASASKAEAKTTPAPAAKAAEKPADKAAEKPAVKSGQLIVQLVAVRDPASAKDVFAKAKALKVPVYTEQITVSNGIVTRVRVGPFDDKKSAEAARAKLAKAGFEPKVITLP